jgi:predicted TPR repeat methyltransferase
MQDLDAAKRDLAAGTIAVNTDIIVPIESLGSRLSKSGPIMVGVDISQRMVDLASLPCNKYSLLTCGHLVDALTSLSDAICDAPTDPSAVIEKLEIVLAADTFIYVGALGLVFQHVAKLLKIGGIFAFSTEHIVEEGSGVDGERQSLYTVEYRFDDDSGEAASTVTKEGVTSGQDKGYTLQDGSARFSHRASYIAALAKRCGFTVSARERHVLRSESSIPIPGMFYALTLDASDR